MAAEGASPVEVGDGRRCRDRRRRDWRGGRDRRGLRLEGPKLEGSKRSVTSEGVADCEDRDGDEDVATGGES